MDPVLPDDAQPLEGGVGQLPEVHLVRGVPDECQVRPSGIIQKVTHRS